MANNTDRRSPLALVLLSLLAEEPMHPYRMREMIKARGKDKIANVAARNSVYQTIDRLQRASLITVRETAQDERRPERTVYELTDAGRETLRRWTRTMLSTVAREFPEFPAALASLMVLPPEDVVEQLTTRAEKLQAEIDERSAELAAVGDLPRLFTFDDDYVLTMKRAELRWVEQVIAQLRSGELTWSEEWIKEVAARMEGSAG